MEKPTLPKGTRDFGPKEMMRRQYILRTIQSVFQLYGFQPLETPSMENLSTLTGKYGAEGDQLLFKILNSGDFLKEVNDTTLAEKNSKKITPLISEKGLRYDLTVPFARYVVMNQHELVFPFKRYQMQPVWRADRPQKGRYREFYQCDADVVGTDSLVCEAEIISMIQQVFQQLKLNAFTIHLNHRALLGALAEAVQCSDASALFGALDKFDKIEKEKRTELLQALQLSAEQCKLIFSLLDCTGSAKEKLALWKNTVTSPLSQKGVDDLQATMDLLEKAGGTLNSVNINFGLARGLSYYTGCIMEVKLNNVSIGSVCGGGRYDNLTSVFGSSRPLSGVGISFGIDRLYDALTELNLFPDVLENATRVLLCHLDEAGFALGWSVASALRKENIATEIFPDKIKIQKQLDYANKKKIPFALILGSDEVATQTLTLKNLQDGTQKKVSQAELITLLR